MDSYASSGYTGSVLLAVAHSFCAGVAGSVRPDSLQHNGQLYERAGEQKEIPINRRRMHDEIYPRGATRICIVPGRASQQAISRAALSRSHPILHDQQILDKTRERCSREVYMAALSPRFYIRGMHMYRPRLCTWPRHLPKLARNGKSVRILVI